jgi:hypothetical protein
MHALNPAQLAAASAFLDARSARLPESAEITEVDTLVSVSGEPVGIMIEIDDDHWGAYRERWVFGECGDLVRD